MIVQRYEGVTHDPYINSNISMAIFEQETVFSLYILKHDKPEDSKLKQDHSTRS